MKRWSSKYTFAAATFLMASSVFADEPAPAASAGGAPTTLKVAVEITPIFGAGAPISPGYNGVLVRLQNNEQQPVRGEVEVETSLYSKDFRYRATAPFTVGAGGG